MNHLLLWYYKVSKLLLKRISVPHLLPVFHRAAGCSIEQKKQKNLNSDIDVICHIIAASSCMYSNQLSLIFSSYIAEFSEGTDNWHIQWLLIFEAPVTLKRQNSKRPFLICNGCNLGSKTWIIQSGVQVKVLTMGCNEVAWSALSFRGCSPQSECCVLGQVMLLPWNLSLPRRIWEVPSLQWGEHKESTPFLL